MLDQTDILARTEEILHAHLGREGALLPILHEVQENFGHIPEACLPLIAQAQQISAAELHGVISFYHDFRRAPAGRHVVKICRAEACQTMGCDALSADLMARLGLDWHGTTPDGRVTLEPVFCLGLCACGPSAMIDGQLHGRLTGEKLAQIVGGLS